MIKLRKIEISDLESYKYWQLPTHKYHLLNGPYFEKQKDEEITTFIQDLRLKFENTSENPLPRKRLISDDTNQIIGEVSWYWKSEETLWMEIGIVIYDEQFWGNGIGYDALKLWITELFDIRKDIVRLGLTTWSGNTGMIKLAEKLKMKKEAAYRKARIVDGQYYDSISFGILKEEWQKNETQLGTTTNDDERALDTLTHSFFNIFTNTNGRNPDWELIHEICIPETIIIKKAGTVQEIYNLESFIKPRKTLLSNGALLEFEEREIRGETKITGNLAQRNSVYKKTGMLNGNKFEQFGNKIFQFLKSNGQWKINSVAWEDR